MHEINITFYHKNSSCGYTKSWLPQQSDDACWQLLKRPNSDVFVYNKTKWWLFPIFCGGHFWHPFSWCIQNCRTDNVFSCPYRGRVISVLWFVSDSFLVFFLLFGDITNDDCPWWDHVRRWDPPCIYFRSLSYLCGVCIRSKRCR